MVPCSLKKIVSSKKFLFLIYGTLIILSSLSLESKVYIPFYLAFSLFMGWIWFFGGAGEGERDLKLNKWLVLIPIFFILVTRVLPFFFAETPLGYDTGIYKKMIEDFARALPEVPHFSKSSWGRTQPFGLFLITDLVSLVGLSGTEILYGFYVFLSLLLGFSFYVLTKRFFNQDAAILALFIFALSLTQFQAYWMMYYKNLAGLFLMLMSFYLLEQKSWLVVPVAGFLGGLHRPTFYIFGLSMFAHFIFNSIRWRNPSNGANKDKKYYLIAGIGILVIAASLYIHNPQAVLQFLSPDLEVTIQTFLGPAGGGGTFFDFHLYRQIITFYLPFAVLGMIGLIKERKFDYLFFWFLFNFLIVYFGLLFHRRFIIHLDVIVIVLSAATLSQIMSKMWQSPAGKASALVLALGALVVFFVFFQNTKPLVSDEELAEIISLAGIAREDEYVMATHSFYSPWVYGFSQRKTIAPGLFEYNKWDRAEWWAFWNTKEQGVWHALLDEYEKPLYIFVGDRQPRFDFSKSEKLEKISERIWKYE